MPRVRDQWVPSWERAEQAVNRITKLKRGAPLSEPRHAFRREDSIVALLDSGSHSPAAEQIREICSQLYITCLIVQNATDLCEAAQRALNRLGSQTQSTIGSLLGRQPIQKPK